MPMFEFECKKCTRRFEALTSFDATKKYKGVQCSHCGSKRKTFLISAPAFSFANPEGTDVWNSDTAGHDYRFKHKLPKVLEERKNAEIMSHMGTNPYGGGGEADFDLDTGVHDADSRPGLI